MLWGFRFNLFKKLGSKDQKSMSNLLISKIFNKDDEVFDERFNRSL